ncbi:MAG: PD-(D/E)XK nuclease-like domain-containing protein [Prevotellaceae bacterium]|jgi:hypothetical protein|nr:PD-(D/E)XK nuclease-like domain-containing protein [Prevotellaceae bacterium]
MDAYYSRKEVSNSDLSALKQMLFPREMPDPTNAYRFGNLIDAMITEPERVDFFKRTVDDIQFTVEDFERAECMKRAFFADEFCRTLAERASGQEVMTRCRKFNYSGYGFELDTRCKWDLWRSDWGWGGDIKSTAATTQSQFEAAAKFFDYDRQRAWYMDIAGSDRDILIGISKVNFKVFKVAINRQSELYRQGFQKYNELAFKWHLIYG